MNTILLLDMGHLTHRAWYTTGSLSHQGTGTGVVYGVLRDLVEFQDQFDPVSICFCFDSSARLRVLDYPGYKANRTPMPEEFKEQVLGLYKSYLGNLGYRNIFRQRGYEADDLIAALCDKGQHNRVCNSEIVIVSGDSDLYQLLGQGVSIFNPKKKKITTEASFTKEKGMSPIQWVDCKAIAGCKTDNIEGIKGVGEKTAAKFLSGKLDSSSKAFEQIVKGDKIWKRNRHLVRLPYPGVKPMVVVKDKIKARSWYILADSLGMKSLRNKAPERRKQEGFGLT